MGVVFILSIVKHTSGCPGIFASHPSATTTTCIDQAARPVSQSSAPGIFTFGISSTAGGGGGGAAALDFFCRFDFGAAP